VGSLIKTDELAYSHSQIRNRRSQLLEGAPDLSGLRQIHPSVTPKSPAIRPEGRQPPGRPGCDPRPRKAVSLENQTAYKKPGL